MTPAETKAELIRRMRAKDLDATLALIADDAVYFWSNGAALFGRAAIAEALAENFAAINQDTYDVDDVTWVAESRDVAACVFAFRWSGLMDGERVSGRGRGATVLRRGDTGWQVVHEHLSNGSWRGTQ